MKRVRVPWVIGRTTDESSPAWPAPVRAKEGAPNVLYIVLDDTGSGQLGCFGSPIQTPNLDGIAANGLRYNNMHTTSSRHRRCANGRASHGAADRRSGKWPLLKQAKSWSYPVHRGVARSRDDRER